MIYYTNTFLRVLYYTKKKKKKIDISKGPWTGIFTILVRFSLFLLDIFWLNCILHFDNNYHSYVFFIKHHRIKQKMSCLNLVCVWDELNFSAYLHFQLIFATIQGSYCTFWYYSWVLLYYSAYFLTFFLHFHKKVFSFS